MHTYNIAMRLAIRNQCLSANKLYILPDQKIEKNIHIINLLISLTMLQYNGSIRYNIAGI